MSAAVARYKQRDWLSTSQVSSLPYDAEGYTVFFIFLSSGCAKVMCLQLEVIQKGWFALSINCRLKKKKIYRFETTKDLVSAILSVRYRSESQEQQTVSAVASPLSAGEFGRHLRVVRVQRTSCTVHSCITYTYTFVSAWRVVALGWLSVGRTVGRLVGWFFSVGRCLSRERERFCHLFQLTNWKGKKAGGLRCPAPDVLLTAAHVCVSVLPTAPLPSFAHRAKSVPASLSLNFQEGTTPTNAFCGLEELSGASVGLFASGLLAWPGGAVVCTGSLN